jgi:hypothetical protein
MDFCALYPAVSSPASGDSRVTLPPEALREPFPRLSSVSSVASCPQHSLAGGASQGVLCVCLSVSVPLPLIPDGFISRSLNYKVSLTGSGIQMGTSLGRGGDIIWSNVSPKICVHVTVALLGQEPHTLQANL